MPIYEYECPIHGIREYLMPIGPGSDISMTCPVGDCPLRAKKVMSSGSFRVKGVYRYSLERPQDIRARERNQALRANGTN